MDALSKASHNVSSLLNRKLDVPPIPIETIKRQENNEAKPGEEIPNGYRLPKNIVQVFGIWKVFLEIDPTKENETNVAYVVISADFVVDGYRKGEWENVKYRGFYTTFEEAKNEISGYLR